MNNGFSEPCAGIFKFLDVYYECGYYSPYGSNNFPYGGNGGGFPFNNYPNNNNFGNNYPSKV